MIYLCLGRREQGKTTLAYFLVRNSTPRVIFDPRGLFPTTKRLTDADAVSAAFEDLYLPRPPVSELVITPEYKRQQLFEQVAKHTKNFIKETNRSIGLLIDEVRFIRPDDSEDFDWILRCTTRDATTIVMTAHRPIDLSVDVRAISDVWCVFQTTQENDLKVLSDRCTPAVAAKAMKLHHREFIAWDDTRAQFTLHMHPDRWFVPLMNAGSVNTSLDRPIDSLSGLASTVAPIEKKSSLF